MTDLMELASSQFYLYPVGRAQFERNARFLAELRHTSAPSRRRALLPRIAGRRDRA
jgi:hypothetical protein